MYKIIIWLMLAAVAPLSADEVPANLQGRWVLAENATRQAVSALPHDDAQLKRYLPTLLKRMRRGVFVFEADAIRFHQGDSEQAFPVTLEARHDGRYVFRSGSAQSVLTLTIIEYPQGTIGVHSSATDDLDVYRWRRGSEPEKGSTGQDANALMRSQLNNR